MTTREWDNLKLLGIIVFVFIVPPWVYYIGIPGWMDPFMTAVVGIVYFTCLMCLPVFIAANRGGNPYSPASWQAHCKKHNFTYYKSEGCRYCK